MSTSARADLVALNPLHRAALDPPVETAVAIRLRFPDDELGPKLTSSRDVARFFTKLIGNDRVESMIVVGVNARLHVTFHRVVGRGGLTSCGARVADMLRPIVMNASFGAMLVHNHPSGDPTPSEEDIALTRRANDACALLDMKLLDHVERLAPSSATTGGPHLSVRAFPNRSSTSLAAARHSPSS